LRPKDSIGNDPLKLSSKHHKYGEKTVILQHFYLPVCAFRYAVIPTVIIYNDISLAIYVAR